MKKLRTMIMATLMVIGISAAVVPMVTLDTASADVKGQIQSGAGTANAGNSTDLRGSIKSVVNTLLFVIGAVSVIVIIIGAIMYTVSAGDPGRAKKAKDAILYAIIGVVVAILAYAIVEFVIDSIV